MKYWYGFLSFPWQAGSALGSTSSRFVYLHVDESFLSCKDVTWCWQSNRAAKKNRRVLSTETWNFSWILCIFFLLYLRSFVDWTFTVPIYLLIFSTAMRFFGLLFIFGVNTLGGSLESFCFFFFVFLWVGVQRWAQTTSFTQINLNGWNTSWRLCRN